MKAEYIIQELNGRSVNFSYDSPSIEKCLQIKRIMDGNKTVKGYYIHKMDFDVNGLKSITLIKTK